MIGPETRRRVEDFLIDYVQTIDDGGLDAWPSFFTRDGRYSITTRENRSRGLPIGIMFCEGRGMMEDRMLALRTANIYEPHTYCHVVGQPRLRDGGDGLIEARSAFTVVRTMQDGRMALFAAGQYFDRISDQGENILFLERTVVLESRNVDVLIVMPL